MRRLTLVRHATAQWKDARMSDFERPLNRRGLAESAAVGRRLLECGLLPDLLLTSPALRTRHTAEIFARELKLEPRRVQLEERLYLASAAEILRAVQATGPRIEHLMIVGHNPGISEFARLLAPADGIAELATAAVCSLLIEARDWSAVGSGAARQELYESPRRWFPLWV